MAEQSAEFKDAQSNPAGKLLGEGSGMSINTGQNQNDASENLSSELFRVGVKVPPFYPDSPALWFAQLDGQFILSGVKQDSTKFYFAIAQLEHQFAVEIADLIQTPPKENMYLTLKNEIIRRLSASKEQKVRQFLDQEEMGNRKPSQYLRHLMTLAGPEVPVDFIRTIWASRLPKEIQPIVASHQDMKIDKLAALADHIFAIASPASGVVSQVQQPSTSYKTPTTLTPQQQSFAMEAMALQIAELTKQVAALSSHRGRSSYRGRRRFNSRSRSRSRSRDTSGICWYHRRFQSKASKCTKPCQYQAENYQGSH